MRHFYLISDRTNYEFRVGFRDDGDPSDDIYIDPDFPMFKTEPPARRIVDALNTIQRTT